ncbi:MAG TPA: class I SAM-dependent methyltransferase, partial [Gemmatimonadaceae bacterium]|nr:class I SAM-dependent methyltransferase [Gemmatimonadaceae bacterium]
EYKRRVIGDERPRCRYEAVATDLTSDAARDALFARLGAESRRTLVVSEGLLIYLTREQVGALAAALHAVPSFHWWLFDLAGPLLLRIMNRTWGRTVAAGNAAFHFAPAEGTEFFRPFGWPEAHFRSGAEESHRLRREMRLASIWRIVSRLLPARTRENFRRMFGFVLLERDDAAIGSA